MSRQLVDHAVPVTAAIALISACVISPAQLQSGPIVCPYRLATGLPCPGCGLTRSWTALFHGEVGASLHEHPFGPFAAVVAIAVVAVYVSRMLSAHAPLSINDTFQRSGARLVAAGWIIWWVVDSATGQFTGL